MEHYVGNMLEWSDAASFARCPAVVVCYDDRFTMASNWIDAIVVTRTKKNRFTVYSRKYLESLEAGRGHVWETLDADAGLRSGGEVVSSLLEAESYLAVDLDWDVVVEQLARLDWCSAAVAANQHSVDWPKVGEASMRAVVAALSPDQVEQVLEGIESWNQPDMLPLLRHLHQKCGAGGGRSASAWPRVEDRLFGDPTRIVDRTFDASLMDGPSVDLLGVAGFSGNEEVADAVWASHNWRSLVEACNGVSCEVVDEHDAMPGMSDSLYRVAIEEPRAFARELRERMVECVIQAASDGK